MKKAIILAGGRGTRLSPLTDETPKPLMPFLGKSLLERIIEKLAISGVTEAMISTMYRSDKIKRVIGDKCAGVQIKYLEETTPLGTAGGLKFAPELLSLDKNESFIVISGDCVCDFDIKKISDYHEKINADATIVTVECDSPLEYGIVLSNGGMICGFNEKPPWSQVNGNRVNTGIYVLKASVIDMIPQGNYDFSGDLFPEMLKKGMKLAEFAADGYWCDIGNIESYYKCCLDALDGEMPEFCRKSENKGNQNIYTVSDPCYIPESAQIGSDAVIGPNTVLGHNCSIGKNTEISGSIIHDGVRISDSCRIEGTIICEGAVIGSRCCIGGGTVIGSGAVIPSGAYIPSNTVITSKDGSYTVTEEKKSRKNYFSVKDDLFTSENGIFLGKDKQFTRNENFCITVGTSVSDAVGRGGRIGVMYDSTSYARSYTEAVMLGLEKGNASIYDFGEGFEKLAKYLAVFFCTDCFIYITSEQESIYAGLYNRNALPPSHSFERQLQQSYRDISRNGKDAVPKYRESIRKTELYYYCGIIDNLKAYTGKSLFEGAKAAFVSMGEEKNNAYPELEMLKKGFAELGGSCVSRKFAEEKSLPIIFYSSKNGIRIAQSNYVFDKYHITAALIERERSKGRSTFLLPYVSPEKYSGIIGSGANVISYPTYSGKRFSIQPELLKSCYWMTDDIMLAARGLSMIYSERKNLSELAVSDMNFSFKEKTVFIPDEKMKTLIIKKLSQSDGPVLCQDGYEGIKISYPNGKVTVVPGKAQYFKIYSEAVNSEIAESLCEQAEKNILDAAEDK